MDNTGVVLLLVEDDDSDVLFMKRALEKAKYPWRLRVAANGVEALDLLSGACGGPPPTHVLLDLKLPIKSGLEVLEWIRSDPEVQNLPVIVLTSSREPSDVTRAQALGVDAYLVKPVGFQRLVDTVEEIASLWKLTAART